RQRQGRAPSPRCAARHRISTIPGLLFLLSYGIVRHVNMRHPTFRSDPDTAGFQTDANGFLYDPHIREMLARSGRKVDAGTEAVASVRILAKKMHALMQRS